MATLLLAVRLPLFDTGNQDMLSSGVNLVWIVDPHFKTVTIYQNNAEPELVNINQQLTAEPHLPGLVIRVSELFN